MTKIAFLFSFAVLTGCSASDSSSNSTADTLSSKKEQVPATISKPILTKPGVTREQLLGLWTHGLTEHATFHIGKDSIYYVEQLESYPYVLQGDSMTIFFTDYSSKSKVELVDDTLVLSSADFDTSKFTRFKN